MSAYRQVFAAARKGPRSHFLALRPCEERDIFGDTQFPCRSEYTRNGVPKDARSIRSASLTIQFLRHKIPLYLMYYLGLICVTLALEMNDLQKSDPESSGP
jgi:hypothetical protein